MLMTTEQQSIERVVREIAEMFDVYPRDLKVAEPQAEHREARQVLSYVAYKTTGLGLKGVGEALGGVDYTRVALEIKRVKKRMADSPIYRMGIESLLGQLEKTADQATT